MGWGRGPCDVDLWNVADAGEGGGVGGPGLGRTGCCPPPPPTAGPTGLGAGPSPGAGCHPPSSHTQRLCLLGQGPLSCRREWGVRRTGLQGSVVAEPLPSTGTPPCSQATLGFRSRLWPRDLCWGGASPA